MVTIAEKTMREVEAKCTRKAEDEEVGCSRSAKAACFMGDLTGFGPSSTVEELGKISSTFCGECGRMSSVKNLTVTGDTRASGIDWDMHRWPSLKLSKASKLEALKSNVSKVLLDATKSSWMGLSKAIFRFRDRGLRCLGETFHSRKRLDRGTSAAGFSDLAVLEKSHDLQAQIHWLP